MKNCLISFCLLLSLFCVFAFPGFVTARQTPENAATASVQVIVSDKEGKPVSDLRAQDFQISEENQNQQIAVCNSPAEPMTVLLLLDVHDTIRVSLEDIKKSALSFQAQLRPTDHLIVASFENQELVMTRHGDPSDKVKERINALQTSSGTRLYDVTAALLGRRLNQIPGRKTLVIFTDGFDKNSAITSTDLLKAAEETEVIIHPVECRFAVDMYNRMTVSAVDRSGNSPGSAVPTLYRGDYEKSNAVMRGLAGRTGGRFQQADNLQLLNRAFSQIAEDLRGQYRLGWQPTSPGKPGQRRKIKVTVNRPDISIRARGNYVVAPVSQTSQ
jgi:Ca-activated chloride channel family protein